jgi:hypothetical protein
MRINYSSIPYLYSIFIIYIKTNNIVHETQVFRISREKYVVTIAAGVVVANVGFSSIRDPVVKAWNFTLYPWIVILGICMWRKMRVKKMISR